jgi:hypothetical protein
MARFGRDFWAEALFAGFSLPPARPAPGASQVALGRFLADENFLNTRDLHAGDGCLIVTLSQFFHLSPELILNRGIAL